MFTSPQLIICGYITAGVEKEFEEPDERITLTEEPVVWGFFP